MSLKNNVSRTLKRLRIASGLSFEEFAKNAGVAKSTLQNLEAESNSTLDTITTVEQNLCLPEGALLSDAGDGNLPVLTDTVALISIISTILKQAPEHWRKIKSFLLDLISNMDNMFSR